MDPKVQQQLDEVTKFFEECLKGFPGDPLTEAQLDVIAKNVQDLIKKLEPYFSIQVKAFQVDKNRVSLALSAPEAEVVGLVVKYPDLFRLVCEHEDALMGNTSEQEADDLDELKSKLDILSKQCTAVQDRRPGEPEPKLMTGEQMAIIQINAILYLMMDRLEDLADAQNKLKNKLDNLRIGDILESPHSPTEETKDGL